jgi:hypothetical protein
MRKIFLVLLMSMFLVSFASAVAEINYNVFEGIVENDGSVTKLANGVSGFEVEGYICLDLNCETLGEEISNLNPVYSGSSVKVNFPTTLVSSYGYVLYFHKEGRIGWEQYDITYAGTGSAQGDNIYLSRKRTGYAPVQNLSIINDVNPGMPLELDYLVSIDADTHSALVDNTHSDLNHGETVETKVTLDIFDDSGDKIHTQTKILNILYSGSERVEFDYTFTSLGSKTIKVSTDVIDEKIIDSLIQSTTGDVRVIEQGKLNYSFSQVNDLTRFPLQPKEDELVSFNVAYSSKFVDDFGVRSEIGTDLEIEFYLEGNKFNSSNVSLAEDGSYSFNYVFPEGGNWRVKVTGIPNPKVGDFVIDSRSLEFYVINISEEYNDTNKSVFVFDANIYNLTYTNKSFEQGDLFHMNFSYLINGSDGLGNFSSANSTFFVNLYLDGMKVFEENFPLGSEGDFDYKKYFNNHGNYVFEFSLCPVVEGLDVANCKDWSLAFKVADNGNDDDEDNEEKSWDDDSGFDLGPSIFSRNESYKGIVLNEEKNFSLGWILLLFGLCILALFFIVLLLIYRNRQQAR